VSAANAVEAVEDGRTFIERTSTAAVLCHPSLLRTAPSASSSNYTNKHENTDLDQEGDRHDRDGKEHVARR
jgi:hypothetical protein